MIDEDFRAFVQARAVPGVPMEKGRVSEEMDFAVTPVRVYYQRANENRGTALNRDAMLFETVFDVEVGALDDALAQPKAEVIKFVCDGYQGCLDKTFVHSMFVQDQSDDYQPRLLDVDQGIYGSAFQVKLVHTPLPRDPSPEIEV